MTGLRTRSAKLTGDRAWSSIRPELISLGTAGDGAIGLEDATDILQYWGDPGTSPAANLRDRYVPDTSKPWRTAAANDGIDGTDVLAALGSFGHRCL